MSSGDEPADQMDQRGYLGEGGEPLGHVTWPGPPNVAVEGIVQVGCMTQPDQRTRHMGPSNRPVPRLEKDVVYLECQADSLELRHDVAASLQSISLPLVEKTLEPGIVKRKEITQDMHLAPGRCHRELTPTDHAHLVLRSGGDSRRHSVECVVIGQCDRRQAGGLGPRNHFFRSELAVRRGRVKVQVDPAAGYWFCGGQALYPVSGAVQPGWDRFHNSFSCWSDSSSKEASGIREPSGE